MDLKDLKLSSDDITQVIKKVSDNVDLGDITKALGKIDLDNVKIDDVKKYIDMLKLDKSQKELVEKLTKMVGDDPSKAIDYVKKLLKK